MLCGGSRCGTSAHLERLTHTLSGEVIPLSEEWERMPGMQRLITLDGVIYVHQNPKRRRRPVYEEPAVIEAEAEEEPEGAYSEPSAEWSPEPEWAEVAAVMEEPVARAEEVSDYEPEFEAELEPEPEPEPAPEPGPELEPDSEPEPVPASWPGPAPDPVPEPAPVATFGGNTRTIVRSTPVAPPPGYAVEFGTGRIVKIHSYKGRMTYPSGGW